MKVIGFKKVNFETPEHQQIKGYRVFCTLAPDESITGTGCEVFFVSETKADGWIPRVNEEIDIVYNKYGKIDRIIRSKAA